ncbi:hypothetical protein JZ751_001615 [Albula glossodonta]|uniref:E3 ubiquitin-protein ligase RNF181 n=1 Tax=Albula glossodonta TaxID=121402 RepID=A0A8T2PTW3_9TELE|nr:hypothetical protein JZ751_001615 [Albula glossodonta]
MASYFDEHDCEPTNPEEQYRQNALLELARSLMQGMDIDLGPFEVSDWDQRLPPPAARAVTQNLPTVVITPEQADKGLKCPVCLLEFEEQETVRKMPCEHLFHSSCILPWLGKTNSCPLCRLELPTDNKEYEEFRKDKVSVLLFFFAGKFFSVLHFLNLPKRGNSGGMWVGVSAWLHIFILLGCFPFNNNRGNGFDTAVL